VGLTTGQRSAIALSTTTTDQFIAWQGVAGAGKTYALNQFKALAIEQNYLVKGFAPSFAAAAVLADELGIETTTTASLLFSKQSDLATPNQIWIVDEAGLLSALDCYDLLLRAQAEQARVILVGDTRQQGAVEAGSPFRSLQQAGIATVYLDESLRQKTQDLKEAVKLIASGEIDKGINHLEQHNRITVIKDEQSLQNQIVSDYLALAPHERAKTLVLTGTNVERLAIAKSIRDGLKTEGRLGAEGVTITQLLKKDLTDVQMSYSHHYELEDVVAPVSNYKRLGLSKEQLYTVVGKNKNTLTLESIDGTTFKVNPNLIKVAVYTRSLIEIAPGDFMKWTRNERHLKRHNGLEFTVKSIDINALSAQIQYLDGEEDNIDLSSPQHLDYTIVTTNYSSQGKSADRVLVAAVNAIDSESFYVAVSRVKHDLRLYTADVKKLIENAYKSRAKENPIELLKYQVREQIKNQEELAAVVLSITPEEHLTQPVSRLTEPKAFTTHELQPPHSTTPIPQVEDITTHELHPPHFTTPIQWPVTSGQLPVDSEEVVTGHCSKVTALELNQMQPDALWEHFSAGIDLKPAILKIGKITQNALRDGLHRTAVRFMLLSSPYFKDIERHKGRTIAEKLAHEVVFSTLESDPHYLWEKEAIESTACAIKFLYLFGTVNADRVLVFEGKKFSLASDLKTGTTTITARDGMREILRVKEDMVITFNPTPEERQLLSELRKDIADIEQQVRNREDQTEIERDRGRGFSR
jgi:AAA domain